MKRLHEDQKRLFGVIAHELRTPAATLEHKPDLIITDCFMPPLDGRDMIRKIREMGIETPIMAVTAATIGAEQEELFLAGADLVLGKPLTPEKLEDSIKKLSASGKLVGKPEALAS